MGADVAASPHCPFAGTLSLRFGRSLREASKDDRPNRGSSLIPPESVRDQGLVRCPRVPSLVPLPCGSDIRSGKLRKTIGPEPKLKPYLSGVIAKLALRSVSPRAPRSGPKPWRFAARQIRNLRPLFPLLSEPKAEASVPSGGGILGRSLGSA